MKRMLPWMLMACALAGCEDETAKARKEGLGKATADATNDTQILGKAEAAANEVLRNPADCDAVKAALPEANRLLGEAGDKLQTPAGRATLDALKAQVRSVSQNCP
jgi:outer membrane PBP1 activator LpoA protein